MTHHQNKQQSLVRSVGNNKSNKNFLRNSLQIQSRDFEQLCEFMMRVNPLYDTSEGWRESSDDENSYNKSNENNLLIQKNSFIKNDKNSINTINLNSYNRIVVKSDFNKLNLQKQRCFSFSTIEQKNVVLHSQCFAKKISI